MANVREAARNVPVTHVLSFSLGRWGLPEGSEQRRDMVRLGLASDCRAETGRRAGVQAGPGRSHVMEPAAQSTGGPRGFSLSSEIGCPRGVQEKPFPLICRTGGALIYSQHVVHPLSLHVTAPVPAGPSLSQVASRAGSGAEGPVCRCYAHPCKVMPVCSGLRVCLPPNSYANS